MATKKFPSELSSRGTVKVTDKLLISNIDTGATEVVTVTQLLAALSIYGNVGIGTTSPAGKLTVAGGNILLDAGKVINFVGINDNVYSLGVNASGIEGVYTIELSAYSSAGAHRYISLGGRGSSEGAFIPQLTVNTATGNVGIGTTAPTSKLQVTALPVYNDNANAAASGLTNGAFYRTGDLLKVVHA